MSYTSPEQIAGPPPWDFSHHVTQETYLWLNTVTAIASNPAGQNQGTALPFWPVIPDHPQEGPPWLITSAPVTWLIDILSITAVSTTPCHLSCRYGHTQPTYRVTPIYKRGLKIRERPIIYYRYTGEVAQAEPGDTLAHSFQVPAPAAVLPIWWYCHGTIFGLPSPSISPITKFPA